MTEGDKIEPIKDSKAISDTRRHLQTLRSVHSCSTVPIQDSQSGGNDNQIKHKEQNIRSTGLQRKHKDRKKGGGMTEPTYLQRESEAGADIRVIRLGGGGGGSPKFKIPNTHKTSVLLSEPPCYCGDGQSWGSQMSSIREAVIKMWSSQLWMQQDHQTTLSGCQEMLCERELKDE